jgi:hypothetical protein
MSRVDISEVSGGRRPRRFEDLRRQVDEELARHPDGERIREEVRRELEAELAAHADASA